MVRSWDEFVFKRALPKTLSEPTTSSSSTGGGYNKGYGGSGKGGNWRDKHKNKQQQGGGDREQGKDGGGGPGKEAGVVDPAAKRDRRPQVRAILLCGPPGMCFGSGAVMTDGSTTKDKTAQLSPAPTTTHTRTPLKRPTTGMGKTTLAHVVAQHCGYRPFEINASDDRSAPVLREKIVRSVVCVWGCAMEAGSVKPSWGLFLALFSFCLTPATT